MNGTTITVSSLEEAIDALNHQTEDGPIVLDPDGNELLSDGDGGAMYSDGANAACYGPLSSLDYC